MTLSAGVSPLASPVLQPPPKTPTREIDVSVLVPAKDEAENLPRFMDHLETVTVLDEERSHWVAKGPAGTKVEWDAVIHNEIPNQLIAWRSLEGSEVDNAGSVLFSPTETGDTEVRVVLRYDPPGGKVGSSERIRRARSRRTCGG